MGTLLSKPPKAGVILTKKDEAVTSLAHSLSCTHDPRKALLSFIRGTRVVIPNLQSMFSHWPQYVNPEIGRLNDDIQMRLELVLSSPEYETRLRKMKTSNVALFGASWWPYAPFEALRIVTYLSLWLFLWDDETDSIEYSSLVNDFEGACAFRRETVLYLETSLSLDGQSRLSQISTNPFIVNFKQVGEAICQSYNPGQTSRFLDELRLYIRMCEEEQRYQVTSCIPTVDEYLERRMGSGAVRVCLALTEFAYGIELPGHIRDHPEMKGIWNETNIIICISNDILSFKKEIDHSQTDSLIPILSIQFGSVQQAIDHATELVRSAISRFSDAENNLRESYSSDTSSYDLVDKFINGCKYACTGNVNWTSTSERFKLNLQTLDSKLEITL